MRILHLDSFVAILSTYYTVMENCCCLYLWIGNSSRYRDIQASKRLSGERDQESILSARSDRTFEEVNRPNEEGTHTLPDQEVDLKVRASI